MVNAAQDKAATILPYREVILDTPIVVTPTATATQLLAGKPFKWCFSFIIRVRSMGTATYIRLGNFYDQEYSLTLIGQTLEWSGNPGQVCDLGKMYVISDTADASLEIIAEYMPLHLVGHVNQSVGGGM
jgi:hypothetical protein